MLQTAELQPGYEIQLKAFGRTPREYRRRLLAQGLFSGMKAKLIRTAPLGCPLYLEIGKIILALRKEEAQFLIWEKL